MSELLNHVFQDAGVAGPALLLIHPLGGDLHFWDRAMTLLRSDVSCVACDLRSAGSSPRSAGPVTIEQHVADLEHLRVSLGLEFVIPVGCAIGAMSAAAYAATHAQSCPAVVLTNPTSCTLPAARAMLHARAEMIMQDGMQAILPEAVDKAFLGQPRDAWYWRYFESFARQDAQAYANSILGVLDADISAYLKALRCPTLVLGAALDVLLPLEHAHTVHRMVAAAEYAQLEDAAHFIPLQNPARFVSLLLYFLRRHGELPPP